MNKINNKPQKPKFDTSGYVFSVPLESIKDFLDRFNKQCEDDSQDWPTEQEQLTYCVLKRDYEAAKSLGESCLLLNAIESRITGIYNGKKPKAKAKTK